MTLPAFGTLKGGRVSASGPATALTLVNVSATPTQLDAGTSASVYVQNMGQSVCVVFPYADQLPPTETGTYTVSYGVPVTVASSGGTTVGYAVSGSAVVTALAVVDGGAAV